eukprot:CAMPEP_0172080922 /NCGR_PEP_ID=MMETSP1043-20130122/19019_1 /TAXON_ID=464988 /ORGANISM="Hemiselmis andersenii, Strain CCMP441" /LENGTH=59 /DNA_ID=CAMNT_0012742313 /DNA_START=422 /DNA_END=597 /DNA_ORIENTATION=-
MDRHEGSHQSSADSLSHSPTPAGVSRDLLTRMLAKSHSSRLAGQTAGATSTTGEGHSSV